MLAPGRYKDTLRGGEQLFYAVNLKPGQQLTAGVTVSGRTEGSYFMKLNIYSPLRQKDVFKGSQTEGFGATDKSTSLRVEGQRVGERNAGGNSDSVYAEPGTYYVSVAADDFGRNLEADQFDSLLDLQVTGQMIPEATPTATATPAATVQSGQTAGPVVAAATAAPASWGSRSCSASRWAGWWASASGGCGRRRSSGADGEEAAEGADQRAEHEHDAEHALVLGMAEERVLQQRAEDRERDRPHRADQRAPGGAPGGASGARARGRRRSRHRGRRRAGSDQHDEHEQEDDRARAVAVGEEPERVARGADDLRRVVGGQRERQHLGLERAALERGERAELERVDAVVDRVQPRVDERDRQRAAAAAAAVGGDLDDQIAVPSAVVTSRARPSGLSAVRAAVATLRPRAGTRSAPPSGGAASSVPSRRR